MANYIYVDTTGVIIPDTSTIQAEVEAEYREVFGADLNTDPSTPQGALITAEVLARSNMVRNNALVANQINPNLSGGPFLDAIAALTGLQRGAATRSVVLANLTGQPGTIVPEGVRARTSAGDVFASLATVVLNASGLASVEFRAIEYGAIAATTGALNQIVSGVLGWETVTNPAPATLGTVTQADSPFRGLRTGTLALQGVATPTAITSNVTAVEGVRSMAFLENVKKTTEVIEGISLEPNSIFVSVDGGSDLAVATAILAKKDLGCNYNGNTEIEVIEPVTQQAYAVKFERPEEVPILIEVTVGLNGSLVDPNTAVPEAIMAYVNGLLPGEQGFVVGGDVSPFEIGAAVNSNYPTLYVKKVRVAIDTTPTPPVYSTDDIPISKAQVPRTDAGSITVLVV